MIILTILFLITACIYSSVGFGGGSTYLALLLLWGVPFTVFPVIALCCNIIVVLGNCINYTRAGNLNLKLLIPYLIGSVPLAFLGGTLSINKEIFEILLFTILTIAGLLLLINFKKYDDNEKNTEFTQGLVFVRRFSTASCFPSLVGFFFLGSRFSKSSKSTQTQLFEGLRHYICFIKW